MNYNLLEEKWIPVLYLNGTWDRVGIRKVLDDAGCIRQIAASNPMDRVAILRFLLALLYWCKGNPPAEFDPDPLGSFPADWFEKLNENEDCFNLLGTENRFYQANGAQRHRAVTDLIQEIPTGNNFWHFRHSTDGKDGLCLACCATGLLRLPLFSVSGLPNLKAGINGTPPVYAVPWGQSLFETLLANWLPFPDLGTPAWVQPDLCPTAAENIALLTGITLLSRRVWLHDPCGPPGACVACGGPQAALVRTCEFQTAGPQKNEKWNDPHVVYSDETPGKASRAADLTAAGKFTMDRPWTDLLARIMATGKFRLDGKPLSLLVVGFATDQAKNIDVWERTIRLPSTGGETAASSLRQWLKSGATLVRHLQPVKKTSRKHAEIPPLLSAIRPHVEGQVSATVGELLAGGDEAWQRAAGAYRPMMKAIAESLSPGFTTAALSRRQQIAAVIPDMRPQAEPAKKSTRKKGGDK